MSAAALRVSDLVKRYGDKVVLKGVSLEVREDEVTCLVGANGSGKTTIVECVEGLRRPDSGSVELFGRAYTHGQKRPPQLGVQLQEESLPARVRVGEAMEFFRRLYSAPPLRPELLELLGIDRLWNTKFVELSGGQKRRVVVALATVGAPRLVILDEPTSGLDPGGQEAVLGLIEALRAEGVAVLVTIHDMSQAADIGDRVALLHDGELLAMGPPQVLVAGLEVTNCLSAPVEVAFPAGALDALQVAREVVHGGRRYLYGDEELFDRFSDLGGVTAMIGNLGARIELRPVSLLDVFISVVGDVTERSPRPLPAPQEPAARVREEVPER